MKLVIPLHSLYWSIHTNDESNRGTAFAFIFGVNCLWRCGVTTLFHGIHELHCLILNDKGVEMWVCKIKKQKLSIVFIQTIYEVKKKVIYQ